MGGGVEISLNLGVWDGRGDGGFEALCIFILEGVSPFGLWVVDAHDPGQGIDASSLDVFSQDIDGAELSGESVDGAHHETKNDCATDGIRKDEASTDVVGGSVVAETDGQDGDITKVQGVRIAPCWLDAGKDTSTAA